MLINKIKTDIKEKCKEEGITQVDLANKVGTSAQYLNRLIKNSDCVINKTFISIVEQLGYNVEIKYKKIEK